LLIGHDGLSGLLATLGCTEVVETRAHLYVMAPDLPVVLNCHTNGVLVGDPKECNFTADRVKRTDLDGLTGFNSDSTQFSGLEFDPPIAAGSDNERKDS
jgi:hypothetical protein